MFFVDKFLFILFIVSGLLEKKMGIKVFNIVEVRFFIKV